MVHGVSAAIGVITPLAAIPTGEAWFTPFLNIQQRISLAAQIATAEAWYPTIQVDLVQRILPTLLATGEAWFAPAVRGSIRYLNLIGIVSKESWPAPTITGGAPGVFLFLSGIDRTQYLSSVDQTFQIQSQTIGRWTATFDLYDATGSFAPVLGQTVLVLDFGRRVFAGCITQVVTDRFLSTADSIAYHVTAVDKSGICDHRVITGKVYPAKDIYGNPADVAGVILDIVANFLNGEGITTSGVPNDGSLGALESDLNFNFPTVTNAFDQIATLTGTVWWIDSFCVLYFASLTALPAAPFGLTETSANWRLRREPRAARASRMAWRSAARRRVTTTSSTR